MGLHRGPELTEGAGETSLSPSGAGATDWAPGATGVGITARGTAGGVWRGLGMEQGRRGSPGTGAAPSRPSGR